MGVKDISGKRSLLNLHKSVFLFPENLFTLDKVTVLEFPSSESSSRFRAKLHSNLNSLKFVEFLQKSEIQRWVEWDTVEYRFSLFRMKDKVYFNKVGHQLTDYAPYLDDEQQYFIVDFLYRVLNCAYSVGELGKPFGVEVEVGRLDLLDPIEMKVEVFVLPYFDHPRTVYKGEFVEKEYSLREICVPFLFYYTGGE